MGKIQPRQIDLKNFPLLGGGAYTIRDVLWENTEEALQKKGDVINLTRPYDYYDLILLEKMGNGYDSMMTPPSELSFRNFIFSTGTSPTFLIHFTPENPQKLIVDDLIFSAASALLRITGIKFVNPNIYSTEEQRIGTWIDGSPLYQITVQGISGTLSKKEKKIGSIPNLKTAVSIGGVIVDIYGNFAPVPEAWVGSSNSGHLYFYALPTGEIISGISSAAYVEQPCWCTVQYTKKQ